MKEQREEAIKLITAESGNERKHRTKEKYREGNPKHTHKKKDIRKICDCAIRQKKLRPITNRKKG